MEEAIHSNTLRAHNLTPEHHALLQTIFNYLPQDMHPIFRQIGIEQIMKRTPQLIATYAAQGVTLQRTELDDAALSTSLNALAF